MQPFSLVYQITQDCCFQCDICLRYYRQNQGKLNERERLEMVDILKKKGLKRLAITGGEPTILKNKLYEFIEAVHRKRIHTSLITTSTEITKKHFAFLGSCLDHIMIPFRSPNSHQWYYDFGQTEHAKSLYQQVVNILSWTKRMSIIVEVNTVVHRKNINLIREIGKKLVNINPNIIWRLDEYYPIGVKQKFIEEYVLSDGEFAKIIHDINNEFLYNFREIIFQLFNKTMMDLHLVPDAIHLFLFLLLQPFYDDGNL